jgi:hypothetical protein
MADIEEHVAGAPAAVLGTADASSIDEVNPLDSAMQRFVSMASSAGRFAWMSEIEA